MTPALIYRYCFRTDAITQSTEFPDSDESYDSGTDSGSSNSDSNLSKDDWSDVDETTKADEEETKEPF